MLANKRVGLWSWALTSEEAVIAITVARARQAGLFVPPHQSLRYDAMVAKQRKLTARGVRAQARGPVWRT